jgi:dsDNA-specific endonuclease/ATPase MutS2
MGFLDWLRNVAGGPKARQASADSLAESDTEADLDLFDPFPEPVAIEIRDVIDLHTIPPRDVKRVVEEYLLEARRAGFRSVRIIHGKGIGVQREMVRSILARTSFVEDWTDAPPDAGGLGATIARLESPKSQV